MLPALALSLLFMWPPVTTTCRGEATEGITYEIAYVYAECPGWALDEPPACGRFAARVMTGDVTRWETAIGTPDPPVGAGYWYEVRARNAAGLWSDEPCL